MTKLEKSLQEQIELQKKIIDLQAQLLQELRKSVPLPYISIPSVWQVGCQHEFPNPWFGTVPPSCKKCGERAPTYTITSSIGPVVI